MHVIDEVPIRPNRSGRVDEMEFRVPALHLTEVVDEIILPPISEQIVGTGLRKRHHDKIDRDAGRLQGGDHPLEIFRLNRQGMESRRGRLVSIGGRGRLYPAIGHLAAASQGIDKECTVAGSTKEESAAYQAVEIERRKVVQIEETLAPSVPSTFSCQSAVCRLDTSRLGCGGVAARVS